MNSEFSFASRQQALSRFAAETFDFLIIGGGITGVAVARDAASRGLRVALIEKADFASGTSSTSSKLVHGGLRYLENFEFKLVFESLSERAQLIRNQPNMVRWLKFYLPVYQSDPRGKNLVSIGLWLYDLLSLFRAPHFHRRLSKRQMIAELPNLRKEGLTGGFTYYDASMWDDVMCMENARAAADRGAAVATRVEATTPIWRDVEGKPGEKMIAGFSALDHFSGKKITVHAHRTIVCGGPFTDQIGTLLLEGAPAAEAAHYTDEKGEWKKWLKPSRGTHLVFAKERFPVPGALLLSNVEDSRISFVIPRMDFGTGVVIVGTTDGPSPENPEAVHTEASDVAYLFRLLTRYFPELNLTEADVLARYVGVRPLMDPDFGHSGSGSSERSLSSVSREHHIDRGPGGTVLVAGGKYTTHRTMALEIADRALKLWDEDFWNDRAPRVPRWKQPHTDTPVNLAVSDSAVAEFRDELDEAKRQGLPASQAALVEALVQRYGADARIILELHAQYPESQESPNGFPYLEAQLRYAMRKEMVLSLEDFYFRRIPLYLGRKDHAENWIFPLSAVWALELGKSEEERTAEVASLREKIRKRDAGYHPQ